MPSPGRDEQVLDLRHRRRARRRRDRLRPGRVGTRRQPISRWPSSAQSSCDTALQRSARPRRLAGIRCPRRIGRAGGSVGPELALRDLGEELVRQPGQDAGAVARVRLGAARAAMIHAAQ